FKVPQLRGLYQKVGMVNAAGKQTSGFGYIHDGSIDSVFDFLHAPVFTFQNDDDRRDVAAFVLAFDTGLAPSVGMQTTVGQAGAATARLQLLMAQADAGNCELVVKGVFRGEHRGFLYVGGGMFLPDRQADAPVSVDTLVQGARPGSEITFTGVPVGT